MLRALAAGLLVSWRVGVDAVVEGIGRSPGVYAATLDDTRRAETAVACLSDRGADTGTLRARREVSVTLRIAWRVVGAVLVSDRVTCLVAILRALPRIDE